MLWARIWGWSEGAPAEEAEPGFFLMPCKDAVLAHWHLINSTPSEDVDVTRGWSDRMYTHLCVCVCLHVSCRISRKLSTKPWSKLCFYEHSGAFPSSGKTVNYVNISKTQGDVFFFSITKGGAPHNQGHRSGVNGYLDWVWQLILEIKVVFELACTFRRVYLLRKKKLDVYICNQPVKQ